MINAIEHTFDFIAMITSIYFASHLTIGTSLWYKKLLNSWIVSNSSMFKQAINIHEKRVLHRCEHLGLRGVKKYHLFYFEVQHHCESTGVYCTPLRNHEVKANQKMAITITLIQCTLFWLQYAEILVFNNRWVNFFSQQTLACFHSYKLFDKYIYECSN